MKRETKFLIMTWLNRRYGGLLAINRPARLIATQAKLEIPCTNDRYPSWAWRAL